MIKSKKIAIIAMSILLAFTMYENVYAVDSNVLQQTEMHIKNG